MQPDATPVDDIPAEFLLVPLQIEGDTNIVRHAPPRLRSMQAFIDLIARSNPPLPLVIKQHPADRDGLHLRLRLSRPQDVLRPHRDGNIHQLLKSGRCRGMNLAQQQRRPRRPPLERSLGRARQQHLAGRRERAVSAAAAVRLVSFLRLWQDSARRVRA